MLPKCFQNVLKDIGIYNENKSVIQGLLLKETYMREKVYAYIHRLSEDDVVYENFMTFLRLYQQPLQSMPNSSLVFQKLLQSLKQSVELEIIYQRLHDVLFYALGSIPDEVIALRRRSFNL